MEPIRTKKFLFGIVVVLLMATSVLPGCNEELPLVEADELVIPSSMTPFQVLNETANAGPRVKTWPFWQGGLTPDDIEQYGPQGASEEQLIGAFGAAFSELFYIKRSGRRAGYGLYKMVASIAVFKYENTEFAERSFVSISRAQELQGSTYGGIALRNGTYTLAPWEYEGIEWDETTMPCYLIHSGCFVIYFYGREDVTKDMLDRIIVAFGNDSANESEVELVKEIAQAEVAKGAEVTGGQPYCNLKGDVICYWFGVSKEGKASGSVVVGSSLYEHIIFQKGGGSPPQIPTADEVSSSVEKCLGLEVSSKDIGEPLRLVYTQYSFYFAIYDIDGQLIAIDLVRKEAVPASKLRMMIASPEQYRQYKEGK